MRHRTIFLLLAILAAAGLAGGCSDDFPSGVTAIFGRVVDPTGTGIFDVPMVATFDWRRTAGAPAPVAAGAAIAAIELKPPYPNPAADPRGVPVVITVVSPGDTTGRVEIWGVVGGVPSFIVSLASGSLSAGEQSFTWDGQYETGVPLPNGLFEVRLVVPASGGGVQSQTYRQAVLINRTNHGTIQAERSYSASSDADGNYTLNDLPVGERFTETRADGAALGSAVVENLVTITFLDAEYIGGPEHVPIGPGEVVDVVTELRAVAPALTPAYGPGPILIASR